MPSVLLLGIALLVTVTLSVVETATGDAGNFTDICTVEPPNNGHLWDIEIVFYREVSCIQRLNNTENC